jgi:hypothetical protein
VPRTRQVQKSIARSTTTATVYTETTSGRETWSFGSATYRQDVIVREETAKNVNGDRGGSKEVEKQQRNWMRRLDMGMRHHSRLLDAFKSVPAARYQPNLRDAVLSGERGRTGVKLTSLELGRSSICARVRATGGRQHYGRSLVRRRIYRRRGANISVDRCWVIRFNRLC